MSVFEQFARPGRHPRDDEDDSSDFDASVDGEGTPISSASKRPRLAGQRDASEGARPAQEQVTNGAGSSQASEQGDLLPDSFRRSPKNQRHRNVNGRNNGHTQDEPLQKHQPGSIVRVKLVDFVTYTSAEFHPGPNLNMIIGPNGTGKSTLVCAICLGLGWATSHLGRAKDLGEFVKHGAKKGDIEIELAADSTRHDANPVIKTSITKDGNKAEYFIDGKKSTKKAVQELARSFSIQVDNLCQFLPQDRVVEFAALSPIDLLTQTQRAAAPEYMSEWHEELKVLRKEQKTKQTQNQTLLEELKHMENKQKAQEVEVQRMRDRSELKDKIATMNKLRPFSQYYELVQQHLEAKQRKKTAQNEFRDLERRVEPNLQASKDKETYLERVSDIASKRRNIHGRYEETVKDLGKKIAGKITEIADAENEIESEKKSTKTTRDSIPKIKMNIQNIERALQSPPEEFDPAEMNAQVREKMRLTRNIDEQLLEIRDQVGSYNEQIRQRERIINDKENERGNLHSQVGRQASKLKSISGDAATIWHWIQNNRDKFQNDVFGPPIVECTVKDPRHAAAVETMIPDGDKVAFTVRTQQDMKMLLDQVSRMKLHDVNIRTSLQGMNAYPAPDMSAAELRDHGLAGWLLDLIDGPEAVLAMLCDNRAIHQMAYATREITERQFDALKQSRVSSWVTPTQSYIITRRREYGDGAVSTRVQPLKQARFFTDAPVDHQLEREIDARINETKDEISELQQSLQESKEKHDQLKVERKTLDDEKKKIDDEKTKKQRAQSEFAGLQPKLDKFNENLQRANEVIAGYKQRKWAIDTRIDKFTLEKGQLSIDLGNATEQLRGLKMQLIEVEIMQIEAMSDAEQLKAQHAEEVRLLEERRAEVKTLSEATTRLFNQGKKLGDKLQDLGQELSDSEREVHDVIAEEKWMPGRLETEIQSLQARLEMTDGGANSENLIQQYEKRAESILQKRRTLNEFAETLEDMAETIKEIRDKWEPELDDLVGKISEAFRENFEQISCVGEVGVFKDEESFENWSIQIRVKFRENEQLSVLDSHRQSGGERAVSTIFYLMALQSLARAPFRVVDEINQGMDPRNERLVHSRMVDIACAPTSVGSDGSLRQGSQYFLITPKLLNGLKYHPKMKVHCIASGEHMPGDHRELDFGALAEKALTIRRGGMVVSGAAA